MMRIEGFNPLLPSAKIKEEQKLSSSATPALQDEFLRTVESVAAYHAPAPNNDQILQVRSYVTTVLFRQNWAEKSSRFNIQFSRSTSGMELQDKSYWKPEQVAKRIVNFAKALSDNTPKKIDELKEAALSSLDDTAKMLNGFNGTLQKTHEEIGREFENWKNELTAS